MRTILFMVVFSTNSYGSLQLLIEQLQKMNELKQTLAIVESEEVPEILEPCQRYLKRQIMRLELEAETSLQRLIERDNPKKH